MDQCYDNPREQAVKESVIKDALVRGLKDERVSITVLAESEDMDLPDLIKLATKHDLAVKAHSLSQKPKRGEQTVSILAVPETQTAGTSYSSNTRPRDHRRCYECGSMDHFIRTCPF